MAVRFVAEVSSNHHQDLDRCFAFIDRSAAIGCAAVKFQLFKIRELFAPAALEQNEALLRREQWELPVSFLPHLAARCQQQGIQFSCTPFYLKAVQELEPYVDFYKVASYELLWDDLLISCARTQKPVVLSTGMATLEEVTHAARIVRDTGCQDLTVLHCVSGYPAAPSECNLSSLETLREGCRCAVGWSDHTVNPAVVLRAVHRWGASMVEFHLDLDQQGEEYQAGHCWLPEEIAPVIVPVPEESRTISVEVVGDQNEVDASRLIRSQLAMIMQTWLLQWWFPPVAESIPTSGYLPGNRRRGVALVSGRGGTVSHTQIVQVDNEEKFSQSVHHVLQKLPGECFQYCESPASKKVPPGPFTLRVQFELVKDIRHVGLGRSK